MPEIKRILSRAMPSFDRILLAIRKGARKHQSCSGFALPEVLVAILIISLLGGTMAIFLQQVRHLDRVSDQISQARNIQATFNFVENMIANAMDIQFISSKEQQQLVFDGDSDHMTFVAPARTGSQSIEIKEITFSIDDHLDGKNALIYAWTDVQINSQPAQVNFNEEVLLNDIKALKFEYLSISGNWKNDWKNEKSLPSAVKISITSNFSRFVRIVSLNIRNLMPQS